MAFSGGTFSRTFDCTTDRDNGVKILASKFDTELDGMATGLSTCILKDGTQTCTAAIPFAEGLTVPDNKTIILGTNSDITIQYDESTNDSLEIAANVEGAALGIVLKADQGDDNADQHKVGIADGGTLTMASKISGSFVSYLTHTPNSTVADSTTAVAGNLTVGGDLTLGSGAVISEAELEAIDGVTAGTVTASKAVIVDSNKDIASFRNVTLTGELDAGSLDVSGDADIDGTLEADAITVNGTALNTVIAGVTVTDATNSAHVLVTDNESTNEENLITFVEDATSSTGNVGLEMDGNLTYNPSTGTVTATVFKGNIDAVDGDFDGTLEADAMTLNGTAITATATLDTGISNNNVPKFTSGVADNDFLRVDGTAIEGRSASEVLSDIAAAPAAGDSNIVTTGALNSGSITSGFGAIDNGASAITTTGVGSFGSLDISGDIDVDGTTNLDAVDIDGAVDMVSTLTVAGNVTSSGTVSGAHALSHRNMATNGAMQIAQRATSATGLGAANGYFTVDRFNVSLGAASAGRFTMSQSTVTDLEGFPNALKLDCTTADTSIAAGEALVIQQKLEGQNVQRLTATSTSTNAFTLSFYAKSNASRAIASEIALTNGTNRQISKLHTIGTSWARYTMTVPAASSTQIDDDNSAELTINFWVHAGSTYTGGTINDDALDSFTNANRAAGIGSLFASTDNTLEITGLQFELGSVTPFEHEDISTTIAKCQRYFFREGNVGDALHYLTTGPTSGQRWYFQALPVQMRADPTDTIYGTSNEGQSGKVQKDDGTFHSVSGSYTSQDTLGLLMSGQDNTNNLFFHNFDVDAEL